MTKEERKQVENRRQYLLKELREKRQSVKEICEKCKTLKPIRLDDEESNRLHDLVWHDYEVTFPEFVLSKVYEVEKDYIYFWVGFRDECLPMTIFVFRDISYPHIDESIELLYIITARGEGDDDIYKDVMEMLRYQ
jgi:hypothetical protein